jgi:glycosyltransferase involved in cell wall biosynthesis
MKSRAAAEPLSPLQQQNAVRQIPLAGKKLLMIVENLPVPFDRRVWQEACALRDSGMTVSIICPTGKGYDAHCQMLESIRIYRHPLPLETNSVTSYLREYIAALIAETRLAWKVYFERGIDVIHACNPPDFIFLVALPFKLLGTKFVFDHHDINPELFEAKFNRRGFFWRVLILLERLTYFFADISIATNESYRQIAVTRGRLASDRVFVVRSGPDLGWVERMPANPVWKNGRDHLVGYVGVIGTQEGVDLLLASVDHIVHTLDRHDTQFVIVGDGPNLQDLKRQCDELGLQDYVTFLGRVPDEELFSVLSTADVCVNPDRFNVMNDLSTMNKVLEYMAMAKPIVQFDLTEGRVSAGDASLYAKRNDPIDFAAKIIQFLNDDVRRRRAGQIGRHRIETELAWHHQAPKLIEAYSVLFRKS